MLRRSFSRGWELFRQNFLSLAIVSVVRSLLPLAALLAFLLSLLPLVLGGFNVLSNPQLLSLVPSGYLGFAGAVATLAVVAAAAALPFFLYLNLSAVVLAHRNRLSLRGSFSLIKGEYATLLVDTFVYWAILGFLVLETSFLYLLHPVAGVLATVASAYVLVRISFWDVLAILGEQHPIRGSWALTEGKELDAFLFFLFFLLAKASFPSVLMPLLVVLLPFESAAKLFFVIEAKRKNNKLA